MVLRRIPDWKWLARLSEEELRAFDIAVVNLACTVGLPGAEQIDYEACLFQVDYYARCVQRYTDYAIPRFRRKRYDYHNSEAYFRVLCLITVLQRDLGVEYNQAKIPLDVPFDTADTFLHGAILGAGGTCVSMPVLYVAVGRRLGYPLKLVGAKAQTCWHRFARWDPPDGKRFNIEAAGKGLTCPPDDYFRTGLYETTAEMEQLGGFLKSETPKEELAGFLHDRALLLREQEKRRAAVEAHAFAAGLAPQKLVYLEHLKQLLNHWMEELKPLTPPGFPNVYVKSAERRFPPALPVALEHHILQLTAVDNLLKTPQYKARWWEKLRRGQWSVDMPAMAEATFGDDGCQIALTHPPRSWCR